MTGKALICKLGEIQDIEGADRIGRVDMFGETLVVSKDHEKGEWGLLFDCETQLSHEFCHHNNLYRNNTLNKDTDKSGYIEDKRRVKPISLKGVKVSGLWMPIESIYFTGIHPDSVGINNMYNLGEEYNTINSIEICQKYIPPKTRSAAKKNKQGKARENIVPLFKEHFDTDHWARNSYKVKHNDLVYITEKLHGTSFRCGNLPVLDAKGIWYRVMYTLFRLLAGFGFQWSKSKYAQDYKFIVGSRRVTKSIEGEEHGNKQHYYDHDLWTEICKEAFGNKLHKGETIYGEIVGFDLTGSPIMGTHSNKKLKAFLDKDEYKKFIAKYGEDTVFTYGCDNKSDHSLYLNRNKVFVYRITHTNEDGETIDLTWEQVKRRCNEMNVDHVPELYKGLVTGNKFMMQDGIDLEKQVEEFTNQDSENFPTHLNEGVCVRIENERSVPQIYKNKRWEFKVLEGIIKESDIVDIEESN